jgi:hypothetical protein
MDEKQPYQSPEIVYEGHLETRAGSPMAIVPIDPTDPLNLNPKEN